MKLGIMQPYFFPYLGYFQGIHAVDKYILYDNLNFKKEAWMNRNRYLLKNGVSTYFHAPLKKKSSYKKIHEIELVDDDRWKKKFLNSLFLNYKKATCFNQAYPIIEDVLNFKTNKLNELNSLSIISICNYLNIPTEITADSSKYDEIEVKLQDRNLHRYDYQEINLVDWQPKILRIIEICRKENAGVFINSIGGIKLYSKDLFKLNAIDLKFIKPKPIAYKQYEKDFVANLSIIDVIMFNSIEKIRELLNQYELI